MLLIDDHFGNFMSFSQIATLVYYRRCRFCRQTAVTQLRTSSLSQLRLERANGPAMAFARIVVDRNTKCRLPIDLPHVNIRSADITAALYYSV